MTSTPAQPHPLQARDLRVRYGQAPALDGADLSVARGQITALVGPNGSGKSTLLRLCARLLQPDSGVVLLDGQDIAQARPRDLAKRLAVLPQSPTTPRGMTVRDLVEQGRYARVGPLGMLRRQDHAAIDRALDLMRLRPFEHRDLDRLSGGERQRAWIALALAQETALIALDEPTTYLDLGHQLEVLALIRDLNRDQRMTVLMVLHDLNHAARFADHLVVLDRGRAVAAGSPWSVLTPELLRRVFRVEATLLTDPDDDQPVLVARRAFAP